ncbi:MAG: DUF309 domain-containing protein [Chloroflexi bacterium]|nr:DUF309 domain-containing protein [Chloroflexota bacterium]
MHAPEAQQHTSFGGATGRCAEPPPPPLLEGIALFNAREFFECHEILELLWRAEPDAIRSLYQGIIQVGVAYFHLLRGNWWGAVKLLDAGLLRLRAFTPACHGVDVARLVHESERCRAELERLGEEGLAGFDRAWIPQVHLVDEG